MSSSIFQLVSYLLTDQPTQPLTHLTVVQHVFHAKCLYEIRPPYVSTSVRHSGQVHLHQVSFVGNHGNLGWMNEKSNNLLNLAPLAWMVQQLKDIEIVFDEDEVRKWFADARSQTDALWYHGEVFQGAWYSRLLGNAMLRPGRIVNLQGCTPASEIHESARLRGYGRVHHDDAVSGYSPVPLTDGTWRWYRTGSDLSEADELREAVMGDLERILLGLN